MNITNKKNLICCTFMQEKKCSSKTQYQGNFLATEQQQAFSRIFSRALKLLVKEKPPPDSENFSAYFRQI